MYRWMKDELFIINSPSTIQGTIKDKADQGLQEFFTRFLLTENKWKWIICLIDQALELCNSNSIPENSHSRYSRKWPQYSRKQLQCSRNSYSVFGIAIVFPGNSYSIPGNSYCCAQALVSFKSRCWINFSIKSENPAEIITSIIGLRIY